MRSSGIRLFRLPPGSQPLHALVNQFCAGGHGIITAASESALSVVRAGLPDDPEVEIEAFGQFTQNLLTRAGLPGGNIVHNGHYTASIAEATMAAPEDSAFWRSRRFGGTHRCLADTLKELRQFGVDLEDLDQFQISEDPDLAVKLAELARINSDSLATLRLLGKETHAVQLARVLQSKSARNDLPNRVLFLIGSETSPLQLDLIRWLSARGSTVWAAIPARIQDPYGAYEWTDRVAGLLKPGAPLDEACDQPWHALGTGSKPSLRFASSVDKLSECEWLVSRLKSCLDAGKSAGAMGVFVRDLHSYAATILSAAEQVGAPMRLARRVPLRTNAFARLTSSVLAACSSSDVRGLGSLVQSGYAGLATERQEEVLELLREAYSLRAEAWSHLRTAADSLSEDLRWFAEVLRWRGEAIANQRPCDEWIGLFRRLLPLLPRVADPETLGRDHRAAMVMQRVLQEYASINRLHERQELGLRGFADLCHDLWQDADVSLPTPEFGVIVSSDPTLLGDREHLFILGMVEGSFPRRRREDPILRDDERAAITRAWSLPIELPISRDEMARERELFHEVCARASHTIECSYPRNSEDRENSPSAYFDELRRLAEPDAEVQVIVRPTTVPSGDARLAESVTRLPIGSDESVGSFTPAELRRAFQCGFRHFVRDQLDLHRGDFATHWHHLRSLGSHPSLSTSVDSVSAAISLHSALQADIDARFGRLPSWEVPLLLAGGKRLISEWVEREFAAREAWPKDAGSRTAEAGFGHGLKPDLMKGVQIRGKVAGTSRLGDYAIVHLVEARSPFVSDGQIVDDADMLYYGIHLLGICQQATSAAVEVDSMTGKRTLMLMPRLPGTRIVSDGSKGLEHVSLQNPDNAYDAKSKFYKRVKELIAVAVERIHAGDIAPRPGPHCLSCEYGELCRHSSEFGEEDSPLA